MDKSHHPQVIRPWKIQQTQKGRWSAPPTAELRREHSKKRAAHKPRTANAHLR